MTEADKLAMLRSMVGEDDAKEVLSAYLELAAQKILRRAFPYDGDVVTVPERYSSLQVEIACYMMNKRGAEGELTHTENGITRQYEDADLPASLLAEITPYVGVIK